MALARLGNRGDREVDREQDSGEISWLFSISDKEAMVLSVSEIGYLRGGKGSDLFLSAPSITVIT